MKKFNFRSFRSGVSGLLLLVCGLAFLPTPVQAQTTNICSRTIEVRDAILQTIDDMDGLTFVRSVGAFPDTTFEFTTFEFTKDYNTCADVSDDNLAQLSELNLAGQGITTLAAGDFAGLTWLGALDLSNNELATLPGTIFSGLTSLADVNLSDNDLDSSLPAGVFAGLDLKVLVLSNNAFSSALPTINHLDNLHTLLLDNNALTSAAIDAATAVTSDLVNLQVLALNSNELTALPGELSFTELLQLNLNINGLTALASDDFTGLAKLQDLRLGGNAITSIGEGAFDPLHSLRLLALSGANSTLGPIPNNLFTPLLDTLITLQVSNSTKLPIKATYSVTTAPASTEGEQIVFTFALSKPMPLYDLVIPYQVNLTFAGSEEADWVNQGTVGSDCTQAVDPTTTADTLVGAAGSVSFPAGATSATLTFCPIADFMAETPAGEGITIVARSPRVDPESVVDSAGEPAVRDPNIPNFPASKAVKFNRTTDEMKVATVTVADGGPPLSLVTDMIAEQTYTVRLGLGVRRLPHAVNGVGDLTYTLGGDLPSGVTYRVAEPGTVEVDDSMDPPLTFTYTFRSPRLSGNPDTVAARTPLTFTVTDSSVPTPQTASLTFHVLVQQTKPRFGGIRLVQHVSYDTGSTVNYTLPAATAGVGALTYTLTGASGGALPSGLTFTPLTGDIALTFGGVLSGTAPAAQGLHLLTYVATDTNTATGRQIFRFKSVTTSGTGGICDRSPAIQRAILSEVAKQNNGEKLKDVTDCSAVTDLDLATVRRIDVSGQRFPNTDPNKRHRLELFDLDGLTGLISLDLSDTNLTFRTATDGAVFRGLRDSENPTGVSALKTLDLSNNNIILQNDQFKGLGSLARLDLSGSGNNGINRGQLIRSWITTLLDTLTELELPVRPSNYPATIRLGLSGGTTVDEGSRIKLDLQTSANGLTTPFGVSVGYVVTLHGGLTEDDFAWPGDPDGYSKQEDIQGCVPAKNGFVYVSHKHESTRTDLNFCIKRDLRVENGEYMTIALGSPRAAGDEGNPNLSFDPDNPPHRARGSVSAKFLTFDRTALDQDTRVDIADKIDFTLNGLDNARVFKPVGSGSINLPLAGGPGTGAFNYSLASTPSLPGFSQLSCSDSRCVAAFSTDTNNNNHVGDYEITYTASRGGESVSMRFDITIYRPMEFADSPAFPPFTSADQTYTVGQEITPLPLPLIKAGTGFLYEERDSDVDLTLTLPAEVFKYTLHDKQREDAESLLPDGLYLHTTAPPDGAKSMRGMPEKSAVGTHTLYYRVDDSVPPNDASRTRRFLENDFRITVLPAALALTSDSVPGQSYATGVQIPQLGLPVATGTGIGALTYTLNGQGIGVNLDGVPAGLSYSAGFNDDDDELDSAPQLQGAVAHDARLGDYSLTFTVTDSATSPASQSLVFTVNVVQGPGIGFSGSPIGRLRATATVTDGINFTFPTAIGGTSPYAYTLGGAPSGIVFTADPPSMLGIATVDTYTLTFTATDSTPGTPLTGSQVFTIKIAATPVLLPQSDLSFTVGEEKSFTLSTVTGGTPVLDLSLGDADGNLPGGLSFTTSSSGRHLILSGEPTTEAVHEMTYGVTDGQGVAAADVYFTLTIGAAARLTLPATVAQTYTVTGTITELTLPAATGGDSNSYVYSLPGLPADLSFDPTARTLSGTIASAGAITITLVYTVMDGTDTATQDFLITLVAAPTLAAQGNLDFTVGDTVNQALSVVSDGVSPYDFTLLDGNDSLPPDLTFAKSTDGLSGVLSGSPTTAADHVMTYTVTDLNGVSATANFNINIAAAVDPDPLTFDTSSMTEFTYTAGVDIGMRGLPPVSNGTAPYAFTLTGAPSGLSFVDSTTNPATLSGTPTLADNAVASDYTLTLSATDGASPTAARGSLTFDMHVAALGSCVQGTSGIAFDTIGADFPSGTLPWVAGMPITDRYLPVEGSNVVVADPAKMGRAYFELLDAPEGISVADITTMGDAPFITGTPVNTPDNIGSYNMKFRIRDDLGCIEQVIAAEVSAAPMALAFNNSQGPVAYARNVEIDELILPTAIGGSLTYTYTVDGLPNDLSFNDSPPTVTGTPTAAANGYPVTYTVTDNAAVQATASLTFTITLTDGLAFSGTVMAQTYTATATIDDLTLPVGAGGTPGADPDPYSYTLDSPPAGLTFVPNAGNANPPIITGTPTAHTDNPITLTYTVTDGSSDTATQDVSIWVLRAPMLETLAGFVFTVGDTVIEDTPALVDPNYGTAQHTGIRSEALGPNAEGEGDLPPGLTFATGTLMGMPTTANAPDGVDLTYRLIDNNGAVAESVFNVLINPPLAPLAFNPASVDAQTFTAEANIGTLNLPKATGGDGSYVYTLTGSRNGLVFSNTPAQPTLSGAPTAGAAVTTLVYTVEDGTGATLDLNILVTVLEAITFVESTGNVTEGSNTTSDGVNALSPNLTLPTATGGSGNFTYDLTPDIADANNNFGDLAFDAADTAREISGTLTEAGGELTWTATDTGTGVTKEFKFRIATSGPFFTVTPPDLTFTKDMQIVSVTLPEADVSNVSGPVFYSLAGEGGEELTFGNTVLPGIVFDTGTRVLFGTPTEVSGPIRLVYKVTDRGVGGAGVSEIFRVSVEPVPLVFAAGIAGRSYFVNAPIITLELPVAGGGTPAYRYTLDGEPTGLSFNADPPTLSGTPTSKGDYSLTFTVTDSGTPTAQTTSLIFGVAVIRAEGVEGIDDRTQEVIDAILDKTGVSDAEDVTVEQLAVLTELDLTFSSTLTQGDLDGLSGLTYLKLTGANLVSLPGRVFKDLAALEELDLSDNGELDELPVQLFRELAGLKNLNLSSSGVTEDTAQTEAEVPELPLLTPVLATLTFFNGEPRFPLNVEVAAEDVVAGGESVVNINVAEQVNNQVEIRGVTAFAMEVSYQVTITPPLDYEYDPPARAGCLAPRDGVITVPAGQAAAQIDFCIVEADEDVDLSEYTFTLRLTASTSVAAGTRGVRTRALVGKNQIRLANSDVERALLNSTNDQSSVAFTPRQVSGVDGIAVLNQVVLPDVSKAIANQNISAVTRRISQAVSTKTNSPAYSLGGQSDLEQVAVTQVQALAEGTLDLKELLTRSSFAVPLRKAGAHGSGGERLSRVSSEDESETAAGGGTLTRGLGLAILPAFAASPAEFASFTGPHTLTVWGSGDYHSIEGSPDGNELGIKWDGDVYGAHIGADALLRPGFVTGAAFSWNQVELDYIDNNKGDYSLNLLSLSPYAGWSIWGNRIDFWAAASYGDGDLEITESGKRSTGKVETRTLAIGVSGLLMQTAGGLDIRLKGEAQSSELQIKDNRGGIAATDVDTRRARFTVEVGGRTLDLRSANLIEPGIEIGVRHDGGDNAAGDAVELGFFLIHRHPAKRLRSEVHVYTLFGRDDYEEWGIQGVFNLIPTLTQGLGLTLTPGYGTVRTGLDRVWQQDPIIPGSSAPVTDNAPTFDARLSYAIPKGRAIFTPYTEFSLGDDSRTWRTGLDWELDNFLDLSLTGERREESDKIPGHTLLLKGTLDF